ncbi:FAD-binding oxidoreductase [Thiomonas sp. FB-Cd]|uniref:NAD(P)/FAD-dependent oxidoreductase n=1 Tax=Thiomonas sp. FB-Cd TaxID=1158292 RepID=UPI000571E20D|nr:FAD-dependent oxidoreductase [Thiomonas sp. FB-Cd]
MPQPDFIVVGAGVVGAACARELAAQGASVDLLEACFVGAGATSAGMGHLVSLLGVPGELEFTSLGVELWRGESPRLLRFAEYVQAGTLWVAGSDSDVCLLEAQTAAFKRHGIAAQLLRGAQLAAAEPGLSEAALAGMRVPGDAILYPPKAAQWLAREPVGGSIRVHEGVRAEAVGSDWVRASDGRCFEAGSVIVTAGLAARSLLADLPLVAKRGHLMITERGPRLVSHQVLEIGYAASTHATDPVSIAFNVQPRPTGQLLIGASREIGVEERAENLEIIGRIARRAMHFLPGLGGRQVIRVWTGMRPATAHGLPIIGRARPLGAPGQVWVAAGHEGLGATTALATAKILAAKICGRPLPAGLAGVFGD